MAEISFAVLLSKNVKQSPLYLEQIEAVIDIEGEKPDPLTLQQIRDEPGLQASFQDRRTNINNLVEQYNAALKKAKDQKTAEQLLKVFNGKLKAEVLAIEKQLQARANLFTAKQKKEVNDLFWARAKLVARVVWAVAKLVKSGMEAAGKATAAVASGGVFLSIVALKSLYGTYNDLTGAWGSFKDAWDDERAVFAKLDAAVKAVKKIKSPKPVSQELIDEINKNLGVYGAKLLGADTAAKTLATKLDKLLVDLEKGKFRQPARQKAAEAQVDATIKSITKTSENIAQGRKLVQGAKSKIQDASKRVKVEPTSFWSIASALWKVVDPAIDFGEASLEADSLQGKFDACLETLKGKLEDEIKDAEVEKATAL